MIFDYRQREQQFADEAQRLIDQHEASKPPKRPTQTNQIYGPGQGPAERTPEQVATEDAAAQLIRRLADRDDRYS